MATKVQKVTQAPPNVSESQPPRGRTREPKMGPRGAQNTSARFSGNWVFMRSGKLAEYPIN